MDILSNVFGSPEQLWQYIKQYAVKAGRETTRTVLELYYVVKAPTTPVVDKVIIIGAVGISAFAKGFVEPKQVRNIRFGR